MKVIIIEGTDNVGKDTIINRLANEPENCEIVHCEKPPHLSTEEMKFFQENSFASLLGQTIYDYKKYKNTDKYFIHNRSWYGEYVYGCMYRDNNPNYVKEMIKNLELILMQNIDVKDLYFITLLSNNVDFLSRNEDGLSLSSGKSDLIKTETERFIDIFNESLINNKRIVFVNNGSEFRDRDDIYNEILTYINTK
jgi:thymidylate kinase